MVIRKSTSIGGSKRATLAAQLVRSPPTVAGKILACGSGECGQLGLGDEIFEKSKPALIKEGLESASIVEIAVGGMHNVALDKSGVVYTWGNNDQHALGRGGDETVPAKMDLSMIPETAKIVKAVLSDSATVLLDSEGHLWICGTFRGPEGIIGATSKDRELPTLQLISSPTFDRIVVVDIVSGSDHFLALDSDGKVWTWGNGQQFQLGHKVIVSRVSNSLEPRLLGLRKVVKIGAGSYHSFAITSDSKVFVWGLNNWNQVGLGKDYIGESIIESPTESPVLSQYADKIETIAGGEHHSIFLNKDGSLYAFGRAGSNQLGIDSKKLKSIMENEQSKNEDSMDIDESISYTETVIATPTKIDLSTKVKSISVGGNHGLAIGNDGVVYSWGFGETNALGHGGSVDKEVPTPIDPERLQKLKIIQVGAGGQHSLFLAK